MSLRLLRVTFFEKGILQSRVMRIANHFFDWARYSRYSHLLGIAQLMWLVLLIAHYMACFWNVVSSTEISRGKTTGNVGEKYIADYYYAVSLIQGQGNGSGTWEENLFSSVAITAGSVILAIVFGNVAMLVSNFNANTTNYHRKMEAVYETMAKMDLPLRLRERVNEYYKHVWLEYESLDGNITKFQQELTHTLGIEVGLYKHMNLIVKVQFWKDCTPDFLTQIVLNLDVRVYMPDDYIVRRREIGSDMMMLNRGYCKFSMPSRTDKTMKYGEMTTTKTMVSTNDLDQEQDSEIYSDYEGDSSDGTSSNDEEQKQLGTGMFGASIDSRRFSGIAFGAPNELDDFRDARCFQNPHPRRPSYPADVGSNKSKKHREYLLPGQVFGEMCLLMNYKRTANIRAITFVEMCVLSRTNFQKIISRYPEDRRRVLTSILESCLEKNVMPIQWESILDAAYVKYRNDYKKDMTRVDELMAMTAKEAAQILVEAIDINAPYETIKYGFQNVDQNFINDSPLRQLNSKFNDNSQRRRSSIRTWKTMPTYNSQTDITGGITSQTFSTETEYSYETPSIPSCNDRHDETLKNLVLLVQNMADNIQQLQQDVSDLKNRDRRPWCSNCNSQRMPSLTPVIRQPIDSNVLLKKEDHLDQTPRKPSFVIGKKLTRHNSDNKNAIVVLRRIRSKTQDGSTDDSNPTWCETTLNEVNTVVNPDDTPDRYPSNLSGRSKAARNPTLADMLWKRSNTGGDLLKHTDEERNTARLRRQLRTRLSLPAEMGGDQERMGTPDINNPENDKVNSVVGLGQLSGEKATEPLNHGCLVHSLPLVLISLAKKEKLTLCQGKMVS